MVRVPQLQNPTIMKTSKLHWGSRALLSLALMAGGLTASSAFAALTVSPIFSSNMVLQRNTTVPVFGTADPGAMVTVQFLGQNVITVADGSGKWQANLAAMS